MMAALRAPGLVTTLVLLLRLLSASAAPHLVGMYDADSPGHSPGGSDPALKGWTNLAMSTAANAAAASHHGGPKNQLLNLQDVLFDTNTTGNRTIELLPDWQQRWKELLPLAKALFANHSATGFFFGDELVGGGGLPLASLVLATDRVRADFPVAQYPEAILFENEAAHIFLWQPDDGHGGPNRWANFTEWPQSLTHVSVDIYHFLPQGHAPILCANGQFNCTAECTPTPSTPAWSAKVKGKDCASAVRLFYEQQLYPRMAPHQKAVLVPGAFGGQTAKGQPPWPCDEGCFDKMAAADATAYFEWAKEDPRVDALIPWHFYTSPVGGSIPCNTGVTDMPLTKAKWETIGKSIVAEASINGRSAQPS
jgi:hypothetical protein